MTRRSLLLVLLLALAAFLPACADNPEKPADNPANPEKTEKPKRDPITVGFDLDDTLLFSSPAFKVAFDSKVKPYSNAFWNIVNASDDGNSVVKKKTLEILKAHQKAGDTVYVITARPPLGADKAKAFVEKTFGIPVKNVYFQRGGKAKRIKELGITVFYGDSDSDISGAREAGARGVRILRSSKSTYKKKYNPGKFDEEIIPDSEE